MLTVIEEIKRAVQRHSINAQVQKPFNSSIRMELEGSRGQNEMLISEIQAL